MDAFNRVKNLIGKGSLDILASSKVAVFGIGGVGSFVAEALVRSGIGEIAVFDGDIVDETNINRQLIATEDSVGLDKIEVIKKRLLSINSNLKITAKKIFYLPETADEIDLGVYDYVIDAVDTVSAKIELIARSKKMGVPVISCMGTAGKLDISKLAVSDISKTSGCPLARVMRRELRKRDICNVKVVYSQESVIDSDDENKKADGKSVPPSMIFVPATAGLYLAKEVVFDLLNTKREQHL